MTLRALSSTHSGYVKPPGPISRMRHCGAGCATEASPPTLCALPRFFPERSRLCFTHCKYCCDNRVIAAKSLLAIKPQGEEMRALSPDLPKLPSAGVPSCRCKKRPRYTPHDRRVFAAVCDRRIPATSRSLTAQKQVHPERWRTPRSLRASLAHDRHRRRGAAMSASSEVRGD